MSLPANWEAKGKSWDAVAQAPSGTGPWIMQGFVPRERAELNAIPGAPPRLEQPPSVCPFAPRCPQVRPACQAALPPVVQSGPGRRVACVLEVATA